MPNVLILAAHPDLAQSRVTRTLLDAAEGVGGVQLRDLYRLYPDYAIDVPAEQQALSAAQLLVLLHPLYWYSMPALQKLWLDEVLRFGWAYGPGGDAMQGKDLWLVSSTGGAADAYSESGYNEHPIDAFLLPYRQTAKLCGMGFKPPLLLHAAHRAGEAELRRHADGFVDQLLRHQASAAVTPAEIPLDARPALFSPLRGDA
jgi:glutathione-regulated potassium-efflux system ancillary protein KefF